MVQTKIYPEVGATFQGVCALELANQNAVTTTNGNLLLVLDISVSMAGEKIKRLRESAKLVIDELPDGTNVLIIVFSTNWSVLEVYHSEKAMFGIRSESVLINPVVQPQKGAGQQWGDIVVNSDTRSDIKKAIDAITTDASTHFTAGHNYGLQWLKQCVGPTFTVTMTDGQSMDAATDDAFMPKFGEGVVILGGKWIVAGIGDDYDFDRLTEWLKPADANGLLVHIKDVATDMKAVFQAVAAKMNRAVFNNIELVIRATAGVEIQEVIFNSTPPTIMNVPNPYMFQHPTVGSLDKLLGIQYAITFVFTEEPAVQDGFVVATVEVKLRNGNTQLPDEIFSITVDVSDDAALVRGSINADSFATLQNTRARALGRKALGDLHTDPNSVVAKTMLQTAITAASDAQDEGLQELIADLSQFTAGFGGGSGGQYRQQLSQLNVRGDTDFEQGFGGKS